MSLDERHAMYVAWVLSIARRYVPVQAVLDADDHVTDRIVLALPEATITMHVPVPPPGWRLDRAEPMIPEVGFPCGTCGTVLDTAEDLARHLHRHASAIERGGSLDDLPGTGPAPRRGAARRKGGSDTPRPRSGLSGRSRGQWPDAECGP